MEYPLTRSNRLRLAKAYRNVPRVDISIECVLEGQMGKSHVDDLNSPSAFEIQVGPFHYFAGEVLGDGGQEMLRNFKPYHLFMPSSKGWIDAAKRMHGECFIGFDRYSFSSEYLSLEHLQKLCQSSRISEEVKKLDTALLTQLWGQEHFIDVSDFESPSDFAERGIGYYIERNGTIIGAAYSSLVCSMGIEVSLYVSDEYRRQGIATVLAAHLIRWCLQNKMDAHWDAANPESCILAEKLGYVPKGKYQAYYLES